MARILALVTVLLCGSAPPLSAEAEAVFRRAAWSMSPQELEAAEAGLVDSRLLDKNESLKFDFQGLPVEMFRGWHFRSYAVNFAGLGPATVIYAFPAQTGDLQWVTLVIELPCADTPDDLVCSGLVRDELSRVFGPPVINKKNGADRAVWNNRRGAGLGLFPSASNRGEDIGGLAVVLASPREADRVGKKVVELLFSFMDEMIKSRKEARKNKASANRDRSPAKPPRNPKP